jgi:hypothetical protein
MIEVPSISEADVNDMILDTEVDLMLVFDMINDSITNIIEQGGTAEDIINKVEELLSA